MESPAGSVCDSNDQPPTDSPFDNNEHAQWIRLQKDNTKLKKKVELLKEQVQGTEELLRVHRELKTQHGELQFEADTLRSRLQQDDSLRQRLEEAERSMQKEITSRVLLQKELSEALERCEKEQHRALTLLDQVTRKQETEIQLRNENIVLKRKLEEMTEEQKKIHHQWKDFQEEISKLIRKTGPGFGLSRNTVKGDEIIPQTPEISSLLGMDLTSFDGQSEDEPVVPKPESTQSAQSPRCVAASCLWIEKSQEDPTPVQQQKKKKDRTLLNTKKTKHSSRMASLASLTPESAPSRKKRCSESGITVGTVFTELKACKTEESMRDLISRTSAFLRNGKLSLQDFGRRFCDSLLSCCSSHPVFDASIAAEFTFLIPWCEPESQDHYLFCKIVFFLIHLDDTVQQIALQLVFSELMREICQFIELGKVLFSCCLSAGLGQLCKATSQNQVLSGALVDLLSFENDSVCLPVLSVLLHSCPELLKRSVFSTNQSCLYDLILGALSSIILDMQQSSVEDQLVKSCSEKLRFCGVQHEWWSCSASSSLTVKLPTGLTPDQQIEKFLSSFKTLLFQKDRIVESNQWFELEIGLMISTIQKGYHWIKGVSRALLGPWIKEIDVIKVSMFGRVLGSLYAKLIRRWRLKSNQIIGIIESVHDCIQHFEQRLQRPRSFIQELLHPIRYSIERIQKEKEKFKMEEKCQIEFQSLVEKLQRSCVCYKVRSL